MQDDTEQRPLPPLARRKRGQRGFLCFNVKFAHAIRRQPIVLATLVLSNLLALTSTSAVWYIGAFAQAPFKIKTIDAHLARIEDATEARLETIEKNVEDGKQRAAANQAIMRGFAGRLDAIEGLLKIIAAK